MSSTCKYCTMFDEMLSENMCHACFALGNMVYGENSSWKASFDIALATVAYTEKYGRQPVHIEYMQAEQARMQHAALHLVQRARKRKAMDNSIEEQNRIEEQKKRTQPPRVVRSLCQEAAEARMQTKN